MRLYRAADGEDLMEAGFMRAPEMSEEAQAGFGGAMEAGLGEGSFLRVLVRETDEDGGFSLIYIWFKPGYPLVRHTHDSDCLYYLISGSITLGNQALRAGDSFFIPADAPYQYTAGPEGVEVLEIRHGVHQFGMKIPDASAARWQEMSETALARHDEWAALGASPTMRANGPAESVPG
jgi:quercetin dioxygenase-like cupin family protein